MLTFSFGVGVRRLFLTGVAICLLSTAPWVRSKATPWPVPSEVFSLDDERMNAWAAQPMAPAVISGRILNLPPEQAAGVAISASLVALGPNSQVAQSVALQADGTFRLEIPATFPRQQLWVRIGRWFYGAVILTRDLRIEVDVAQRTAPGAGLGAGINWGGTDGVVCAEVNRFLFGFERKRQLELDDSRRRVAMDRGGESFSARLEKLTAMRTEMNRLLLTFGPEQAGWLLQNEIDADFFVAVLRAAMSTKHDLTKEPVWAELIRHPSFAVSNEQTDFYRTLGSYLQINYAPRRVELRDQLEAARAVVAAAAPDLQTAFREATALLGEAEAGRGDAGALKTRVDLLRQAGLLSPLPMMAAAIKTATEGLLPPAKRELALLSLVPKESGEAEVVLAAMRRDATQVWLRTLLLEWTTGARERLAAINATLVRSSANRAVDALGQPQSELPTGAKLYHLPGLSGQELLAGLRARFPGKALLLDFWGPWCSPCLEDLPASRRAHEALAGEPIEFVYLGSRTTDGPWRRSIAELKLAGTHVLLETKQVDELMAFFGLGGFPGYAFLDRGGQHRPGVIRRFATTTPEQIRALLR